MTRVDNEQFITHLTSLYQASTSSGSNSIYLSSKRLTHAAAATGLDKDADGDQEMNESGSSSGFPVIYRLTDGKEDATKKAKFSTLVSAPSLATFQAALLPALRSSLSLFLRKRDKAKERKADKILQTRRKKDEELGGWKGVAKLGSKRGAGHRTRQRALKRAARMRKEEQKARKKEKNSTSLATTAAGAVGDAVASVTAAAAGGQQDQKQSTQQTGASNTQPQQTGGGGGGGKKKKKGKK